MQALNRSHATNFYKEIAKKTGGFHLNLDQFADMVPVLTAIAYKQVGDDAVATLQKEMADNGRLNRAMDAAFNTLLGKKSTPSASVFGKISLDAVPPGRFQVFTVDNPADPKKKIPIKNFVERQGAAFKPGRGFYELTKPELVQGTKEIVLQHKKTGDFYTGAKARELLGLPLHDEDVKPVSLKEYRVFISPPPTTALVPETGFLYEVPDWDRVATAA